MGSSGNTPWARTQSAGIASATTVDLLSVCLTRDRKDSDQNLASARHILNYSKLKGLKDLSRADLLNASGLEDFEADRILCAIELGRRSGTAGTGEVEAISGPEDAFRAFKGHLGSAKEERFCAAFLNTKAAILSIRTIHVGTLNMSLVGPREVFREAVRENAASIVVSHNHPSGDPEPSPEDIRLTKRLVEVGDLLDIPVHDHVILGDEKYVSLRERGII